jgi:hypothetical protein
MANTTFTGPVRSQNGFQDISIDSTTGAVTVNATFGSATSIASLTTTGNVTVGGAIIGSTQDLSGSGAVNLTSGTTKVTTTASAAALTLANGTNGQIKMVVMVVDGGGDATITPTTATGYTTIVLNSVGDAVILQYFTTLGWMVISNNGAVVA